MSDEPQEELTARFHPLASIFPLLDGDAFHALVADIKANGLVHPIVEHDNQIIDGRNRYRACIAADVAPRFVAFAGDDLLAFIISTNLHRRHLNESQRAVVAARLANMEGGRPLKTASIGAVSQSDAADRLNVGRSAVQRARAVLDHAIPEIVQRVERGEMAVSLAAKVAEMPVETQRVIAATAPKQAKTAIKGEVRAGREKDMAEATRRASTQIGLKLYSVIYADPPWRFEPYSRATGLDRAADNHYGTMSLDEICALNVPAAKDCALFLWATVPMLPAALRVMLAWGFTYKSHFAWVKDRSGTGYWNANRHELLLVGTMGDVPAPAPGSQFDSVQDAAVGAHSHKPAIFADMIEEMFPTAQLLELFARAPRAGWDVWGNEVTDAVPVE